MKTITLTFSRRFPPVTATIDNGVASCHTDLAFEKYLNAFLESALPPGYYPDNDLALAQRVAETFHATIEDTRTPEEYDEDTVY